MFDKRSFKRPRLHNIQRVATAVSAVGAVADEVLKDTRVRVWQVRVQPAPKASGNVTTVTVSLQTGGVMRMGTVSMAQMRQCAKV